MPRNRSENRPEWVCTLTSRPRLNQYIADWYAWSVPCNAWEGSDASMMNDEDLRRLYEKMLTSHQALDGREDKRAWREISPKGSRLSGEQLSEICHAAQQK